MAFYDEESLESLPLRLFLAFFSLAGVAKGIYGLRETHYSGIVKMVDVVVCVVIVENVSLLSQPSA